MRGREKNGTQHAVPTPTRSILDKKFHFSGGGGRKKGGLSPFTHRPASRWWVCSAFGGLTMGRYRSAPTMSLPRSVGASVPLVDSFLGCLTANHVRLLFLPVRSAFALFRDHSPGHGWVDLLV